MTAEEFRISTLGKPLLNSPLKNCAFVKEGSSVVYETDAAVLKKYMEKVKRSPPLNWQAPGKRSSTIPHGAAPRS